MCCAHFRYGFFFIFFELAFVFVPNHCRITWNMKCLWFAYKFISAAVPMVIATTTTTTPKTQLRNWLTVWLAAACLLLLLLSFFLHLPHKHGAKAFFLLFFLVRISENSAAHLCYRPARTWKELGRNSHGVTMLLLFSWNCLWCSLYCSLEFRLLFFTLILIISYR